MIPRVSCTLSFFPLLTVCIGLASAELSAQDRVIRVGDRVIPPDMPFSLIMGVVNLYSFNPQVRARGAQELAPRGPDAAPAIPFLMDWIADTASTSLESTVEPTAGQTIQTTPGAEVMGVLVAIGEDAMEILLESLDHESSFIRRNAYLKLSEPSAGAVSLDPRFAEALLVGLDDPDPRIFSSSVRWAERYVQEVDGPALSETQRTGLLARLLAALTAEGVSNEDRVRVTIALGSFGPLAADAVPTIRAFLDDGTTARDEELQEALDRIEERVVGHLSPEALDPFIREIPSDIDPGLRSLIEQLKDSRGLERGRAALALQELGPDAGPAVPWLVDLLTDETPLVMQRTGGLFGDEEFEITPADLSAEALMVIGEDAIPDLQDALHHRDPEVRDRVVKEFGYGCDVPTCYDDRFVEFMIELLDADIHTNVRHWVFVWIGRYAEGDPPDIPPGSRRAELLESVLHFLQTHLEDGSEVERLGDAAEALGEWGPDAAASLPLLREASTRVGERDQARIEDAIQKISGG